MRPSYSLPVQGIEEEEEKTREEEAELQAEGAERGEVARNQRPRKRAETIAGRGFDVCRIKVLRASTWRTTKDSFGDRFPFLIYELSPC